MKIYIIRETVGGSVFRFNAWKWYSRDVFQDAKPTGDEHNWHIFGHTDAIGRPTYSTGVWGRFRRCIAPWLGHIVDNYRVHGALNNPSALTTHSMYVDDTPFVKQFVLDIKKEWPEIFDRSAITYINNDHRNYINSVAFQYLEIVESEFGSGGMRILPFHEHAAASMQNYFKKISKKRALGLPVH